MTTMKNKCNKWTLVLLFYSLFIINTICTVNGAPEKLTQEQVLEELGVKIETKGKKIFSFSSIQCVQIVRALHLVDF